MGCEILKLFFNWDRALKFLRVNQEYLVSVCHQRALNTSLPFVHTARRSYRLDVLVSDLEKWLFSWLDGSTIFKICKLDYLEEGEVVTRFP